MNINDKVAYLTGDSISFGILKKIQTVEDENGIEKHYSILRFPGGEVTETRMGEDNIWPISASYYVRESLEKAYETLKPFKEEEIPIAVPQPSGSTPGTDITF